MSASTSSTSPTATASGLPPLPSSFKIVGILLAVTSGLLIGSSFVFKKKGLLRSQSGHELGEGVAYLKSPLWWFGMTLMILGEICNFAAYAFVEAIVVTPLGALSVVISAILSSIFLKETLSFFGWMGCALCIFGSIIIALNAPQEPPVGEIRKFQAMFFAPGFLILGGVLIAASLCIIIFVLPKYGKKSMLWCILVCSMIGGLSVSTTTGLGSAIVTSIFQHKNQFNYWFPYVLIAFVATTLLTEVYYLNVALARFNTAMVTPTYYVIFTFFTLVTTVVLFQGLKASAMQIITIVMGFLVICVGITILQMSKVDPKQFNKLDRRSTMLLQAARSNTESNEKFIPGAEDPGMDALRGSFGTVGSIIRARSTRKSRFSTDVSSTRARYGSGASSNAGNVQRHQLYDAPMPRRAESSVSESISLPPRNPTIKFGDQDIAHYYRGTGAPADARHEVVTPHGSPRSQASAQVPPQLPPLPLVDLERTPASAPAGSRTFPRGGGATTTTPPPLPRAGANAPATATGAGFPVAVAAYEDESPPRSNRRFSHSRRGYPRQKDLGEDREESVSLVDAGRNERGETESESEVEHASPPPPPETLRQGGIRLLQSSPSRI